MATRQTKGRQTATVLPSVLDRLMDDDPDSRVEQAIPRQTATHQLKEAIRRDLEQLLNTRLFGHADIQDHAELHKSVSGYGLPDFSTVIMGAPEHQEIYRQTIEDTISRFETRLRSVRVKFDESGRGDERTLFLRISAILTVERDQVPLLFDSRLHALTREVRLQEVHHG